MQPTAVPAVIAAELTRLEPAQIVILGGTGAVSATVRAALAAYAPAVSRIAGADRYATAAQTAVAGFTAPVPVAYVATGTGFADALAGGAAAAHQGGPMLLTTPTALPAPTAAALAALHPKTIVIVGGTGVVSPAVATALAAYTTGAVSRLAGNDRYDTARVIAQQVFGTSESIVLATGSNFPDALAGVPTAFVNAAPLLLTGPYCAAWPTHAAWITLGATRSITLGGTAVVSDKAAQVIGCITRVDTSSSGAQAGYSLNGVVSGDGRYVAFTSYDSALVPGTGGLWQEFRKDTVTGQTTAVSTATGGAPADGQLGNGWVSISADGRYIAFDSYAGNLVPGDTDGSADVFVKDTTTGTTTRVSTTSSGAQATGGWSETPAISATGRYVAFTSDATDLVPGDTNGLRDVFVKDTVTGTTIRVSTASGGAQSTGESTRGVPPAMSATGRYVAFTSEASDLVPGDTNGSADLFVKDTATGTTTRVSTTSSGAQATGGPDGSSRPAISATGRYVAFDSDATNLVPGDTNRQLDVFVKDTQTGITTRVSTTSSGAQASGMYGSSGGPALSATGRYVAFDSYASNLAPGDTNGIQDVFVKDTLTGTTSRVSTAANGAQAIDPLAALPPEYRCRAGAYGPQLSADGRYIVFASNAPNLVPRDTNTRYCDPDLGDPFTDWYAGVDVFLVQLR